jgi:hypothetical protein
VNGSITSLELLYIHLSRQMPRIEAIDHVDAGPRVARQGQKIDAFAMNKPKHDRRMSKRVESSCGT